jgi:fructokinase
MFLICGEAVIDLFQDKAAGEMAFQGQAAGSPYNVAVGLVRLGQQAALITGISRDAFGARLIAGMEREGVDWRLAPRTDRPTILSFVLVKPDGGPEYAFYGERGADTDVTVAGLPTPLPADIRAIHVGGFPMAVEPAKTAYAALIRRESPSRFVSLDPNIRVSLTGDMAVFREHFEGLCASAALIKASSEDLHYLYPAADLKAVAMRWKGLGASTVVITDGPNGASAWNTAGHAFVPTASVKVVDTVGAGDSFMSALLSALAERDLLHRDRLAQTSAETMRAMLAFANSAAGITCTRRGSNPPMRSELGAA